VLAGWRVAVTSVADTPKTLFPFDAWATRQKGGLPRRRRPQPRIEDAGHAERYATIRTASSFTISSSPRWPLDVADRAIPLGDRQGGPLGAGEVTPDYGTKAARERPPISAPLHAVPQDHLLTVAGRKVGWPGSARRNASVLECARPACARAGAPHRAPPACVTATRSTAFVCTPASSRATIGSGRARYVASGGFSVTREWRLPHDEGLFDDSSSLTALRAARCDGSCP
jgi:hypothetical protein